MSGYWMLSRVPPEGVFYFYFWAIRSQTDTWNDPYLIWAKSSSSLSCVILFSERLALTMEIFRVRFAMSRSDLTQYAHYITSAFALDCGFGLLFDKRFRHLCHHFSGIAHVLHFWIGDVRKQGGGYILQDGLCEDIPLRD